MDRSITVTEEQNRRQRLQLTTLLFILSVALFFLLLFAYPSQAAGWQEAERNCLRTCPSMPRYSGIETESQYRERMRKQAAYDRCFMNCARQSSDRFTPTFVPIGEAEQRYFKRNGAVVN